MVKRAEKSSMKISENRVFKIRLLLLVLMSVFVTGCSMPDIAPFSSATVTLAAAVKEGGQITIESLEKSSIEVNGQIAEPSDPRHPAAELKDYWSKRVEAMDAIVAYSGSLTAITDASINGKTNATDVLRTVNSLANKVPGVSAVSGEAGGLIIFIAEAAIELKAYNDLWKAVGEADKAIQGIAKILSGDVESSNGGNIESLKKIYVGGEQKISSPLQSDVRNKRQKLDKLEKERAGLAKKVNDFEAKRESLQNELLEMTAGTPATADIEKKEQELKVYSSGIEIYLTRMLSLDKPISDAQAALAESEEKLSAHRKENKRVLDMLTQTAESVTIWAKAHSDLKLALKENRRPNVVLLAQKAIELKATVDTIKNKQK